MNTNSNLYTIVYSIILVVVVAAILSIAAISLQPKQNENIKLETVTKVLSAATSTFDLSGEDNILASYAEKVVDAYYVNGLGERVGNMNTGKENLDDIEVPTTSDLKRQNDLIKKIDAGNGDLKKDLRLPVFEFKIDEAYVSVIPCYGPGLWGPIWGYVAVADDGCTIVGAVFDHKSETPGLGAKIAEEPFCSLFPGKQISRDKVKFSVIKNGDPNDPNAVDAISGASITSRSLGACLNTWFTYYEPYLNALASGETSKYCSVSEESVEETEIVEETLNVEE